MLHNEACSQDGSVGVMSSPQSARQRSLWFGFRYGQVALLPHNVSTPDVGTIHLLTRWVSGDFSPGVKRPGSETAHSSPSSAKVKNERCYISTLLYTFMADTETNLPFPLNKEESVAFCSSPGNNDHILPDSLARRVCNRAEGRSSYLPNTVTEQYHTAELSRRQQR
jgi:hypothetical protein